MRKLYSAQIARPLSTAGKRPARLGFATTAWCRSEDLIAVVSGCGAVSVFHADAPGEATVLVSQSRAPARHVCWRPASNKPCMLVVSDAAVRLTFWVSRNQRVNVWTAVADIPATSVPLAIGWNSNSTALAAILSQGSLAIWYVPDYSTGSLSNDQQHDSRSLNQDSSRRNSHQQLQQNHDSTRQQNAIHPLQCKTKLVELFGGPLSGGTVEPGGVVPNGFAVVTVSVNDPHRLSIWQVSIPASFRGPFEVRPFSYTSLDPDEHGRCVACTAVPKKGALFAIGDKGVVAHFSSKISNQPSWQMEGKANIEQETERAVQRGVIPQIKLDNIDPTVPVSATVRTLQRVKRRKVYAFEVSSDCKTFITSTAAGLLVWDTEKLMITAGEMLTKDSDKTPSPYWGLCISPASAALMALNGQGRVDAYSLIHPIVNENNEPIPDAATNVARKILDNIGDDNLRGKWDIIASIASQGTSAATIVGRELSPNNLRGTQGGPQFADQLNNLRSAMLRIANVEDSTVGAAKKLLEVAFEAIRSSAPDQIKLRLTTQTKEIDQFTAPGKLANLIKPGPATDLTNQSLAAAPLADWIMVLSAVWLQKCACIIAKQDSTHQMGSRWESLGNLVFQYMDNDTSLLHRGMCYDFRLISRLKQVALAAVFLLALELDHGEPDDEVRYFRFERTIGAEVVATLWDVSTAWETANSTSQATPNGVQSGNLPRQMNAEQIITTARAFSKHDNVAEAILSEEKLRVLSAERALGLHGSSVGAGYIISCVRKQRQSESHMLESPLNQRASNVQWCPHDLVTGRPLPPWAPLRRCVVSGLLAAEITQQRSDSTSAIDSNSPWTSKWATESPFGGRWARVPSLDLDRYELLPSVIQSTLEKESTAPSKNRGQPPNIPPGSDPNLIAAAHQQQQQAQPPVRLGNNAMAMHLAGQRQGMTAQAATHMNMNQMVVGQNGQFPQQMAGMRMNPTLNNGVARSFGTNPSNRVQASPGLSTVSSTTDAGSTVTKGGKKRGPGSGSSRRAKKQKAPDHRQGSMDQLGNVTDAMATHSVGVSPTPSVLGPASRHNSNLDVLSTDTRSVVTGHTNASTGVDQDISKAAPKRRKKLTNSRQTAATGSNGTQGIGVGGTGMMLSLGNEALTAGTTPGLNPGVVPFTDTRANSISGSKKQQNPSTSSNQQDTAATLSEAGAAAEQAAANHQLQVKQSSISRNAGLLQGGLHGNAMGRAGMQKTRGGMPHMGFFANEPMASAPQVSLASQVHNQRRQQMGNAAFSGMNINSVNMRQRTNMNINQGNIPQVFAGGNGSVAGLNNANLGNVNGMYQLQNGNGQGISQVGQPNNPGIGQFPMTAGMPPMPTSNISDQKLQNFCDAWSWNRPFRQPSQAGGQGNIQASPTGENGRNFPGNVTASSDLNGVTQSMGITPAMINENLINNFSRVGNVLPGNGGGMMNVGQPMTSLGPTMGQPRTSAAESATSVPTRPGRTRSSVSAGAASPNSQPGGDMVSNVRFNRGPNITGAPNRNQARRANGEQGRQLWKGELKLSETTIPCVAIQNEHNGRQPLRDASGWPKQLNLSQFKPVQEIQTKISDPRVQWHARFVLPEPNEDMSNALNKIISVMIERKLAVEIPCNEPPSPQGTLFILTFANPGPTMIGVFLPEYSRNVSEELHMLMMSNTVNPQSNQ